ncbi:MAG: hypothetical protein UX13_C0014G0008 [Candidatus Woesebacteria bacterium GW2011_GWB1_45_5]|uniref:Gram-positive cocci surface proteins LPxTG domain-containing protein n=1 Tax=Candidatus Woesebacteria bacterium GW2011_GWB1_45_5 TaxID=1618581 RepID=A0A0G1QNX9_9BACT|nr:MAG: hypothetical protein UX13_C0014G0008 [Candidatus Woesebacteria bacterium GW2011_GWB1_45_5]
MLGKLFYKILFILFFSLTLGLVSSNSVSAQQEQTPPPSDFPSSSPSPTPSCLEVFLGEPGLWSEWEYAIGGGSRTRTRTTSTFDSQTDQPCGEIIETETEFSWCIEGDTVWYPEGQEPEFGTEGQCEDNPQTTTICLNGETLEVEIELLGQYDGGYTEGVCPTPIPSPDPTATPLSCSGTQHANADNSRCVDFDIPGGGQSGGGTTSTGQVLGASTLAATGSGSSEAGLLMMILGSAMTLASLYAFKKSSVR